MSTIPSKAPVLGVDPQPNIYTLLLWTASVVMLAGIVFCLISLMSAVGEDGGYGLTIGQILNPAELPDLASK